MKYVVALRHKDRNTSDGRVSARRFSKMRAAVEKMRAKVKRDLRSSDPTRCLTALAVALLDETGQDALGAKKKAVRVNDEDPSNVSFKLSGRARRVANPVIVQALMNVYETVDDDADPLFQHDVGVVTAADVDSYLSEFGLSSEKVRGLRASDLVQERLPELRAAGGDLPRHWKSKQKVLRGEFERALGEAATTVGLDPAVVRASYLAPGVEASYLRDGDLSVKMASADGSLAFAVFLKTVL